jgi:hypothetical protein
LYFYGGARKTNKVSRDIARAWRRFDVSDLTQSPPVSHSLTQSHTVSHNPIPQMEYGMSASLSPVRSPGTMFQAETILSLFPYPGRRLRFRHPASHTRHRVSTSHNLSGRTGASAQTPGTLSSTLPRNYPVRHPLCRLYLDDSSPRAIPVSVSVWWLASKHFRYIILGSKLKTSYAEFEGLSHGSFHLGNFTS